MTRRSLTSRSLLSATALGTLLFAAPVAAQTAASEDAAAPVPQAPEAADDVIIVTGTRRAVSLQDAPINLTALSGAELQDQRIDDVRDIAAFSPGLTIQDTGPRNTGTIVMRGLSASDTADTGSNADNSLATYLGEVPLYLDFKLLDINRVEVLLGPQGTLYGLGTLAGAIRYIPNRPDPDNWSGMAHGRMYDVAHAEDPGFSVDGTINVPIVPGVIALRSTVGYYNDPGFIDYKYLVRDPGVSLPQPNNPTGFRGSIGTPQEVADNLYTYKDANFEHTFTTRNQLGIFPADWLNVYLTYAYQETQTDGRQSNGGGVFGSGRYEAPWRFLEPSDRKAHLVSAEIEADIGSFAQFVSATAYTKQNIKSSVDVTDLLLDLDYDYELFPAFAGYTRSDVDYEQFNQEVRFVSAHGGPLSWVVGGFYNELKLNSTYFEILPGYPAYAGIDRPDEIEYASFVDSKTTEKAVYGELSLEPFEGLQLTAGGRYFDYKADVVGGQALPLFQPFPEINFRSRAGNTKDDGFVWKFNGSYKFGEELMVYATYSKGYRIGGVNRVAPCVLPLPPGQNLCALPDELVFAPDEVKNVEVGMRWSLFERRFTGSLAVYHIDWSGIQLDGLTENGAIGITVNGGKAVSKGVELTFQLRPIEGLTMMGNYAYNDAHLTEGVPGLIKFRGGEVDAEPGDRLPGSTKNSGALGATYTLPVGDTSDIAVNWTMTYTGNILTRVGARGFGEKLPSFVIHRASIAYSKDDWEVRLFADNLFDKYAVASVGNDLSRRFVNDGVVSRYYARTVISPRRVGVEMTKKF